MDKSNAVYFLQDVKNCNAQKLKSLFEKTSEYWRVKSSKSINEIYYSVQSDRKYRYEFKSEYIDEFFETGRFVVEKLLNYGREHLLKPAASCSAMDFGCGLGRLTLPLAQSFQTVHAVDFSRAHLDGLVRNISNRSPDFFDRIMPHEIKGLEDYNSLPCVDFILSWVVFQHNTPPVQGYMLGELLGRLRHEGVAVLQFPLHIDGYHFNTEAYLADPKAGQSMEMHVLPKNNIREIVQARGCRIVDTYGGGSRIPYSEFFVIKRVEPSRQSGPTGRTQ